MIEEPTIQQKSVIQTVYEHCSSARANVHASAIRGDVDSAYRDFHHAFGVLYDQTLVSGGSVSVIKIGDTPLLDLVLRWLESKPYSITTKKGRSHYREGEILFRKLVSVLAEAKVLS